VHYYVLLCAMLTYVHLAAGVVLNTPVVLIVIGL